MTTKERALALLTTLLLLLLSCQGPREGSPFTPPTQAPSRPLPSPSPALPGCQTQCIPPPPPAPPAEEPPS